MAKNHYSLFRHTKPYDNRKDSFRCMIDGKRIFNISIHSANRLLTYAKLHKLETRVNFDNLSTNIHIWLI